MSIVVFGSLNLDLVARTPRLPVAGETLTGREFVMLPGGKGANQAVAVARLGVPTQMVGRVGGDSFGQALLQSLRQAGVGCDRVLVDADLHSGVAIIAVDDAGENQIIIVSGANGRVNETDVQHLQDLLPSSQALLLQLEIPLEAVFAAAQAAHDAGVCVILDPAPAPAHLPEQLPERLYPLIDILTPNQVEASQLAGFAVQDQETAIAAAQALQRQGAKTVIVKLGRQGVVCATPDEVFQVPAFSVEAIDTVAAGDAFNGGLAAALAEGLPLQEAVIWGAATGAIAVTRSGAQPSMPTRQELEAFLAQQSI